MAAFTSVQNGNWNDGATWGNSSPGSKGTDWPGNVGDTATIGHTVTYNVSETNALGAVTINSGGTLYFSRSMTTLLTMGSAKLNVNGGVLDCGTVASPIPASYTATIDIQATSSAVGLYNTASGGDVHICGDPGYYGSTPEAVVQANWTSGQTFTVEGDLTSAWAANQELCLLKDGEYSSQTTDFVHVTIASLSLNGANTDITINEAFPGGTFSAGCYVWNYSRNVILGLNGSLGSLSNTGYDSSSGALRLDYDEEAEIELSACRIGFGYYFYLESIDFTLDEVVLHNFYMTSFIHGAAGDDNLLFAHNATIDFYLCRGNRWNMAATYCTGAKVVGCHINKMRYANHYNGLFEDLVDSNLVVEVYKCGTTAAAPLRPTAMRKSSLSGWFGQNAEGLSYWTDDTLFYAANAPENWEMHIKDYITPCSDVEFYSIYRNSTYGPWALFVEAFDGNRGDPRAYCSHGDITLVDADGTGVNPSQRSGGSDTNWMVAAMSNCNRRYWLKVPLDVSYYCSGAGTYTFRVYCQSNYVGDVGYRLAVGHNSIVGAAEGVISARSSQSDWSEYAEVSITTLGDGWAELSMFVWGYEASKYLWVDPLVVVS